MNSRIIREDCENLLSRLNGLSGLKGKSVLITGSNGLIGNYLANLFSAANRLYQAGIQVYCISKHQPLWQDPCFRYFTLDLSRPFTIDYPVDFIFHCACYGRPQKFLLNELETIALNVDTTRILLEAARRSQGRLLFLSTSEIYGNPPPQAVPTGELYPGNALTSGGRAAYVESKRLGEALCYIYRRNYNLDAKIARIALVYGPGITLQDERVMGNFMRKAIHDKHIRMMDAGAGLRTYCYVTDALFMMLEMLLLGKEVLYNVGGVETVSIADMARMTAEYCGATFEGTAGTGLKDAPDIVKLDVTKICREFAIDSFVPFREGLQRTIDWNLQREKK